MNLHDFDYILPEQLIAQQPAEPRDHSRLMLLDKATGKVEHRRFYEIAAYLNAGDVLVLNTTRVIPARLNAVKAATGGAVEILLLRQIDPMRWRALVRGRNLQVGARVVFPEHELSAEIEAELEGAERVVTFSQPINAILDTLGEMPLPPYIKRKADDPERYQTIYSREEGSAAAPTAGLHFTGDLLLQLREKGIKLAYCTLHIGLDTFQPVKVENITQHKIHSEWASLSAKNAQIINEAKLAGGRIIAVGTTSARTLETAGILSAGGEPSEPEAIGAMCAWRPVIAFERDTNLFIYPGYAWRVVNGLITNFHLPKSTLLMMISAFAGREHVLNAYEIAKHEGYRFFSFGDAMFIADHNPTRR